MGELFSPHSKCISRMLGRLKNAVKELFWRIRKFRCRRCPGLDLSGTFLILAPHPDDEALGCGGLIARLCANGNPPHVVIMTGGGGSLRGHSNMPESEVVEARRKLTLASAYELGLPKENIHFLDFIDGHISDRPEKEMERFRELIARLQPSTILVPHSGEGWPDHTATREIIREVGDSMIREVGDEPIIDAVSSSQSPNHPQHDYPQPNHPVTQTSNHPVSQSPNHLIIQSPNHPTIIEYCVWMWYYNVWDLDWKNARKIEMSNVEHAAKLRAVDVYVSAKAPNGDPWSGFLPKPFLKANTSRRELYFINQ